MKTLRYPAVFLGFLVLVIAAATIFVWKPQKEDKAHSSLSAAAMDMVAIQESGRLHGSKKAESTGPEPNSPPATSAAAPVFRWEILREAMDKGSFGTLISKADAERFLQSKGTTAINLLAVATASGDEEFRRRAVSLFPDHPAVQLSVLTDSKDLSATERAEWIARFKASAPDNPLPYLYAAHHAFQQQDPDTALAVASEAIEKSGLYFWTAEFIEASQQLYESKGYSPLEAEMVSISTQPLSHLGDFQKLNGDLVKLREAALKENDHVKAEQALRVAYGIGKIFQSPEGSRTLINQLVGISMESRVFKALPPEVQPSFLEVPRAQREAEMSRLRDFVKGGAAIITDILIRQDPVLLAGYYQRYRTQGEYHAQLWLREQLK